MIRKIKSNYFIFIGVLVILIFLIIKAVYIGFDEYVGQTLTSKIDINTEQDIFVEDILVEDGKKVKKGDVLMILRSVSIENQNSEIEIGLKNIDNRINLETSQIKANIVKIETEKNQKIAGLQAELRKVQEEVEFQQKIDRKSVV
jgi:multidrug efflux pump subunit AcrA (membrane-fusion protein)